MPHFPLKHPWLVIGTITIVVLIGGLLLMRQSQEDADYNTNMQEVTEPLDNAGPTTTKAIPSPLHNKDVGQHTTPLPSPSLTTVEERQRYFDGLLQEAPEFVWRELTQLLGSHDALQREYTKNALANLLQKGGNEFVYAEAKELLRQPSTSLPDKYLLVSLLSDAATPNAVVALIESLETETDPSIRDNIRNGIVSSTHKHWRAAFHPELSPPLEKAWVALQNDPLTSNALAQGIAKIGAPSGVALLLDAIEGNDKSVWTKQDDSGAIASVAMMNIRNPAAVPVLARILTSEGPGTPVFAASGNALAHIGLPEATAVLLRFAKQAPDDAAPLVDQWLLDVRDEGSFRLVQEYASATNAHMFTSTLVRDTVVEHARRLENRYAH